MGEKLFFESRSQPFMKDGKHMCKVASYINPKRQKEKEIMEKYGIKTRKQLKKIKKQLKRDDREKRQK